MRKICSDNRAQLIKLGAGDCVASELRGSTTPTQAQALPEEVTGAITPDQKE